MLKEQKMYAVSGKCVSLHPSQTTVDRFGCLQPLEKMLKRRRYGCASARTGCFHRLVVPFPFCSIVFDSLSGLRGFVSVVTAGADMITD